MCQIYDHAFSLQDDRGERALRIERRNLKYFEPSAAAILLVLHHEYFLLNRQIAREALEVLFKHHTVFLSCGPFVLKALLEKIEQENGPGRQWLKWMKKIELDWVTFPNLKLYPPDREEGRDEWYWEQDEDEVDVDYVRGAQHSSHYDEYDHEGNHYEDNFYEPSDTSLYPSFHQPSALPPASGIDPFGFANHHLPAVEIDPFGLRTHYPFADPWADPPEDAEDAEEEAISAEDIGTKLDLLVSMEVTPLFTYLASPTFSNLSSITIPLYFISKHMLYYRGLTRPGYRLPTKIRYWVHVCVHALLMLVPSSSTTPTLREVCVKYLPWDIWASMDPADDLRRLVDKGIWFDEAEDGEGGERENEGEAFRAVWAEAAAQLPGPTRRRLGLSADIRFVPWDGNVDSWRVGDELEIVLRREGES